LIKEISEKYIIIRDIMYILFSIIGFILVIGFTFVIISTIRRKGKMGINLKPIFCPKCSTPAPIIRKPTSKQETLWGGWTCTNCGCKMDKWGNEIT
jgi:hypothetical protein